MKGITYTAGKLLYRTIVERYKAGEDTSQLDPADLAEEMGLWLADEWTHLGHCLVTCIENPKLVKAFQAGQTKVLQTLIGKAMKSANMTVDAEVLQEMLPWVIERYFQPV